MARSFNGSTDVIATAVGTADTAVTNFSMSIWVYPTISTGTHVPFYNGNSGSTGFGIALLSGLTPNIFFGGVALTAANVPISVNTWSHLALTRDTSTATIYINGVAHGTDTTHTPNPASGSANILIGNDTGSSDPFQGILADAVIWENTVLTALEVSALNSGIRPRRIHSPNLYAWLPIDGLQSPEPDLSGNAINGTVTGTSLAFGPPFAPFTPRRPQFMPTLTPMTQMLMAQIVT